MWNSRFANVIEESVIRSYAEICEQRQDDEDLETRTSEKQSTVEASVLQLYKLTKHPVLARQKHIAYLKKSLTHLNGRYECLDSSRPWLCYWIVHSLQLLGERLESEEYSKVAQFLAKCQAPNGGFSGGPGQYPHLAPTYAAVNTLCTIGTEEAYQIIDRPGLQNFITSLHKDDGSFSMHVDGEVDMRGVYCALSIAKLTNVYIPEMFKSSDDWVAKCQTWEGGFGCCPEMEAHGGYTFCGLAALVLLGKTSLCSFSSLVRWVVNRQMRLEGGFQGRTNKLVDGCYSFWQGGTIPLIHAMLSKENKLFDSSHWLFNQEALQEYILICCQHPYGGLLDKPEKSRDPYHTCYTLSGLSIAQHSPKPIIIGPSNTNLMEIIHPVYNLEVTCAENALKYFMTLPIPDWTQ